jgi:hypothetical protein
VTIVPPYSNLNLIENQHPEHIYVNRKCYHSMNVQLVNITFQIMILDNTLNYTMW